MEQIDERAYYIGFAEALLYAQAAYDVKGGRQTLKTHLPQPEYTDHYGFKFDKNKLIEAIKWLDDEGGIVAFRFNKREGFGDDTIEIGSTEGHFGLPEWASEEAYQLPKD